MSADREQVPSLRVGEGGVLVAQADVAVGAVLCLRQAGTGRLLLARKAERPDYEWGGHWVLPGGLLRAGDSPPGRSQIDVEGAARTALRRRVRAEAGIELASDAEIERVPPYPAPVTRYTARSATRHVLVLAFGLANPIDAQPRVNDPSIDEVGWFGMPHILEVWAQVAPANRIILAHQLQPELSEAERREMEPGLREALALCAQWAGDRGLPPAPGPT